MAGCGEQCEVQILKIGPKGAEPPKYGLKNLATSNDASCALVIERTYDDKNKLENTTLQINSPHILKILKSLVKYYPAVPANFDVPFQLESPFQILFHYWEELHAALDEESLGDDARMHLKLLLGVMKAELGADMDRVKSLLKASSISFSKLWTIFRPGCLVYTEKDSHPWLLRLEKTAYDENTSQGKYMEVHCTYTDYDGQSYGQAMHVVTIYQKRVFAAENPCKVTRLPIFPLDWLEDKGIQERLAERGSRFLKIQGAQVRAYDGLARYLRDMPYDFWHWSMDEFTGIWLPYTETGRVVLDQKTFKEENYTDGVSVSVTDVHEKSERMLCPPFTYGFSLSRKLWCKFYIDDISDIGWNSSALDSLILPEGRKSVLEALVFSHAFPSGARDEMRQKGKGLVVLLHGSPGSGKTLTAESVAEVTEKALLTASIGELNQRNIPALFEKELKRILQYATMWKAVVLLDEADVFLEGRSEAAGVGTEHNALVAVFLKHLEYFSGIVFLTSNRVMVFDKAMKSRIHLALEYKPPSHEMRRRIWVQALSSLPAEEIDMGLEEDLDEFIREEVNGREISNSVGTARTLARFKRTKLTAEHLHTVLETRREFDRSLEGMRTRRQKTDLSKLEPYQVARRNTLDAADE